MANASQASDPASYSRVTFAIEEYDNMVRLTVTHDELEAGSGMAKGIKQGWPNETSSEPIFENHCQCRDCQKRSGTGHGSYLTIPQRADVTITGEANTWRVAKTV